MAAHEHLFDVQDARRRLEAANGGYEVVHESPGLALVAPATFGFPACRSARL